ncbi:uncharacterized protein LACBIDRAFT_336221 [Laccaria bicolor S238N-H82]|uniref:Predicted protein n=1 Tax=Laccaria bicolor (strain S238N-H82 / ATCC MYA-4686) TaxID=486041 RepID=B0E4S8_LACBS|nr:uncharacterized protein LACBIDRAFT_336221 [Laccaria bicolor S238N-H82]EDQ98153.1 predicted protein [Laccaria bicolor S238N-H82]|eukprot:XP_001891195.1 predicted protein [Laccaria bicolor S238N-H82]
MLTILSHLALKEGPKNSIRNVKISDDGRRADDLRMNDDEDCEDDDERGVDVDNERRRMGGGVGMFSRLAVTSRGSESRFVQGSDPRNRGRRKRSLHIFITIAGMAPVCESSERLKKIQAKSFQIKLKIQNAVFQFGIGRGDGGHVRWPSTPECTYVLWYFLRK